MMRTSSRRDERGQGSLEHLGAIVLAVTFILGTITAVSLTNTQVGENIAYQVCKVVQKAGGGECEPPDAPPTPEERIPTDPCVVDSGTINVGGTAQVVVEIKGEFAYIIEELSNGEYRVTQIDKAAVGVGVGPGIDVSVTIDGKKHGGVTTVTADAMLAENQGTSWTVGSREEAEALMMQAAGEDVVNTAGGPLVGWVVNGIADLTGNGMPEPDETFHEGGLEVNASAAWSLVVGAEANASAAAYVGYKQKKDGSFTAYFTANAEADASAGAGMSQADAAAGAEYLYEVNFDSNGNPTSVTMRNSTYANASGMEEDDTVEVTENVYTIPIESQSQFDALLETMKNPFTFADEARQDGTHAQYTYDMNENIYGATVGGSAIGKYGGGVEGGYTSQVLTGAEYWDGTQMVPRTDCGV